MPTVDLSQLEGQARLPIDTVFPAALLDLGEDVETVGDVRVSGTAQLTGRDVVVRGVAETTVRLACRRCLEPVDVSVEAPLALLYREGVDPVDAEASEVYTLPASAREVDLLPAVREHVLLALPGFAVCRAECRGLCPVCGANQNETECDCTVMEEDERWAPLRRLQSD